MEEFSLISLSRRKKGRDLAVHSLLWTSAHTRHGRIVRLMHRALPRPASRLASGNHAWEEPRLAARNVHVRSSVRGPTLASGTRWGRHARQASFTCMRRSALHRAWCGIPRRRLHRFLKAGGRGLAYWSRGPNALCVRLRQVAVCIQRVCGVLGDPDVVGFADGLTQFFQLTIYNH